MQYLALIHYGYPREYKKHFVVLEDTIHMSFVASVIIIYCTADHFPEGIEIIDMIVNMNEI